jgi:hypothetical protein
MSSTRLRKWLTSILPALKISEIHMEYLLVFADDNRKSHLILVCCPDLVRPCLVHIFLCCLSYFPLFHGRAAHYVWCGVQAAEVMAIRPLKQDCIDELITNLGVHAATECFLVHKSLTMACILS